ncbi:MAG: protein-glutamate O-methyltransferase CheR [Candidatus Obscuribacterales bacterium]|nr:protein-glutamate O-methyltransferase CheR [Candidatus Obscuribacterales bacterium]
MNDPFAHSAVNERLIVDLLQELYRRFGLDYRDYSPTFLSRRISAYAKKLNLDSIEELKQKLLENDKQLDGLIESFSLPTTRMFRDAALFQLIRETVIPILAKKQLSKVWSAGCSTGEEAYSLAIVLKEELPGRRVLTFATDLSERSLYNARKGIYQLRRMRAYTSGYQAGGGRAEFSNYYTADHENAMMNAELKKNIVFAQHNLVTDSTFNEFDLILCRNVLIYFNRSLQEHVLNLLLDSLRPGGILILGDKESLRSMSPRKNLLDIDRTYRIYQKTE